MILECGVDVEEGRKGWSGRWIKWIGEVELLVC